MANPSDDGSANGASRCKSCTIDANDAVADIAYRLSEVIAIYPITPASIMGELADAWAADGRPNLWGAVPEVVEMQSEGGAAGAVHGALQAGALSTTFTASQGLLLMLPDLFKIAGELTSFCMHVAARAVATHALSIFGDHSDVMAARSTGMALLASGSAQEAQDLAAIAHAATLEARVPILHFFDGFRTSHEMSKVNVVDDATLLALIDDEALRAHRMRALDPDKPVIRGTSQNPDAYFQSREAASPFYARFAHVLDQVMARFAQLTGRRYRPFDYEGDPWAERVIIVMGSAAECVHETVEYLAKKGERVGVLKVRLFRPFSVEHFLAALPSTVRAITVLDRTKEPGASSEPLMQEVTTALVDAVSTGRRDSLPRLIGGRFGLASKELTPAMVKAAFENMNAAVPKRHFTLGIRDDVSGSSLPFDTHFDIESRDVSRAIFFGLGSDGTVSANKSTIKIIGEETPQFVQAYFEYDSRKAFATTVSHLRFGPRPIRSTYRIKRAHFIAIHDPEFLERRDVLAAAMPSSTVLLNTRHSAEHIWDALPQEVQEKLAFLRCKLFVIDAYSVAEKAGLGRHISTVMQACFFALSKVLPVQDAIAHMRRGFERSWARRDPALIERNMAAVDSALHALYEVTVPEKATTSRRRPAHLTDDAPDFVKRVTRLLLEGRGDELPVSAFPPDGTWPTGTSRFEKRALATDIPIWQAELCVQCNFCSMVCPHAAVQTKVFNASELEGAPPGFRAVRDAFEKERSELRYTVQVAPEDCTGCGLCVEVCPATEKGNRAHKALMLEPLAAHREVERHHFAFFEKITSAPLSHLKVDKRTAALHLPLFQFSGACAGCGETPYLRLLTQLFGDHLVIANATGCSSIFGGNLPTTPYTTNPEGRGPAWSNSLFEDNAEFGLGLRLALDVRVRRAQTLLRALENLLPTQLVAALLEPGSGEAWLDLQRQRIATLDALLSPMTSEAAKALRDAAPALSPRCVWIVGGDGWAYDIGYGGLDHVLASHRNVNILVLDTEVYSNTGGQQSKATPLGAAAKFATAGKASRKKDLGLLAMSYGHVYVAEVAMEARSAQTVQALLEAESYDGPSLVIAHSPCIAHGYDLVHAVDEQKRAIDSGVWPLYRFDPRRIARDESPLVLDSGAPKLDVGAYMENEARFKMVQLRSPERYEALVEAARRDVRIRRALYEQLGCIHLKVSGRS